MADFETLFGAEPKPLPKILIIDFSYLAHRMIHSCDAKRIKEGLTESEMYDFWKHLMITGLMKDIMAEQYFRVVIGYDKSPYWRSLIYPEYKANRKEQKAKSTLNYETYYPMFDDFTEQFKHAFGNFVHMHLDGIECDDIAAVFVKKFSGNHSIKIITGDRDYKQLLKFPNTEIYDPKENKYFTSLNVEKELLLKVVTGDSGDNIKAISGCKTMTDPKANKIVEEGLEVYFEKVENSKAQYELNRKLIDFEYIPDMLIDYVHQEFINYKIQPFDMTRALTFTIENKLEWCKKQLQQSWSPVLARINREDGILQNMGNTNV